MYLNPKLNVFTCDLFAFWGWDYFLALIIDWKRSGDGRKEPWWSRLLQLQFSRNWLEEEHFSRPNWRTSFHLARSCRLTHLGIWRTLNRIFLILILLEKPAKLMTPSYSSIIIDIYDISKSGWNSPLFNAFLVRTCASILKYICSTFTFEHFFCVF